MSPATTVNSPNTTAEITRNRWRGRSLRRVESSAPLSEPIAKQVESSPNASAPRSKRSRAMSAMVTW
jgi:hypothetical protein